MTQITRDEAAELGVECARECKDWMFGRRVLWGPPGPEKPRAHCHHTSWTEDLEADSKDPRVRIFRQTYHLVYITLAAFKAADRNLN